MSVLNSGLMSKFGVTRNPVVRRSACRILSPALLLALISTTAAAQTTTTFAGTFPNLVGNYGDGGPAVEAGFMEVANVAVDAAGHVYVASGIVVRRIDADTGIISTVAGGGGNGSSHWTAGLATSVYLNPLGLAFDSLGNLYISEHERIRKLEPNGVISTFAGGSGFNYSANVDGQLAINVSLRGPLKVAVDSLDNVYIGEHLPGRVLRVDTSGVVTKVAGRTGPYIFGIGIGGPAVDAQLEWVNAIAVDRLGNLYILEERRLLKVGTSGVITSIAGNPLQQGFSGDGGPATDALFSARGPEGPEVVLQIAVDFAGNVFFTDTDNHRVRKIDTGGIIATVAGNGDNYRSLDDYLATNAIVQYPLGVAIATDGALLISEYAANRVRRVVQPNVVPTPTGNNVDVVPTVIMPDGATSPIVELTFESVLEPGNTIVTGTSAPPGGASASPGGFQLGEASIYYDVVTSASFEGLITLCFGWEEGQFDDESRVQLLHFESGEWVDVTTSRDTGTNRICGEVSSLSPFGLFQAVPWFTGFHPPVDNAPTRNIVKAGSAVPVKFSLNGYWGMDIMDAEYPASQPVQCVSGVESDVITETVNAGSSGLTYDASTDEYKYIWKTDKSWANTCNRLMLRMIDGAIHSADFGFTK